MFVTPSLTISEQVQLLKSRGLVITPNDDVAHWLSHIGYFRLKKYTGRFRDTATGNFMPGCTFDDIIRLYLFDKRLKLVLFDAIETIEVAVRTLISNLMSCAYGANWYLNRDFFSPLFRFDSFIAYIEREVINSEEPVIKLHRNFSEHLLPPSWIVIELLPFGAVSRMFEHLSAREIKQQICGTYNLPDSILMNWLHCFSQLRNRCAHHSQIIYRSMAKTIVMPSRAKHRFLSTTENIDGSRLYATLCCIQYLVDKIEPSSVFKNNLLELISNNPDIDYDYMGFTQYWQQEKIWQMPLTRFFASDMDDENIEAGWLPLASLFCNKELFIYPAPGSSTGTSLPVPLP
jgi:abortive infection bacteriophage resistance protein